MISEEEKFLIFNIMNKKDGVSNKDGEKDSESGSDIIDKLFNKDNDQNSEK